MYLHLGQGVVVPYRDVLALFDLDNTSASHLTRRFLERAEQAGQVVNVAEDLPKSFVLLRYVAREHRGLVPERDRCGDREGHRRDLGHLRRAGHGKGRRFFYHYY